MATLRSSYVAAAAPNSGGWVSPLRFQTMHTPALMTMHGAPGGDVVIVDFSETSARADKAFKAAGGHRKVLPPHRPTLRRGRGPVTPLHACTIELHECNSRWTPVREGLFGGRLVLPPEANDHGPA